MRIPLSLAVAQWVLLLGLGMLVIVMYRQLAYLLRAHLPASAERALSEGTQAPSFDYQPTRNGGRRGRFTPGGVATLLAFADPFCVGCVTAVRTLAEQRDVIAKSGVRVVIATTASSAQVAAVDAFSAAPFDIWQISASVPTKDFGAELTPFMFVIDEEGVIRGRGVAALWKEVRALLKQLDRPIDSGLRPTQAAPPVQN